MLEFQSVNPVRIDPFYIEIVKVFVDTVYDPDAKGQRISVVAQIHAVNEQVFNDGDITIGLQDGIGLEKSGMDFPPFAVTEKYCGPERVLPLFIIDGNGTRISLQVLVSNAVRPDATVARKVGPEKIRYRIGRFLFGYEVGHGLHSGRAVQDASDNRLFQNSFVVGLVAGDDS